METRTTQPQPLVTAPETLRHIIELASQDLPFAAHVGQLAWQGESLDELGSVLDSLYRISLDHGHTFLPDLVDSLLRRIELARDLGASGLTPWREAI